MAKSTVKDIKIGNLKVDKYQRGLEKTRAEQMASEWDTHLVGTIVVSERKDSSYFLIDGQHRVFASKLVGNDTIRAEVFRGLTPAEEAELFVKYQKKRKGITPVDEHNAKVFYGDTLSRAIERTSRKHGFRISNAPEENSIRAIRALEAIHRSYGKDVLDLTLATIASTWFGISKSTDGTFLKSVALFLAEYSDKMGANHYLKLEEKSPVRYMNTADVNGYRPQGRKTQRLVVEELRKTVGLRKIRSDVRMDSGVEA